MSNKIYLSPTCLNNIVLWFSLVNLNKIGLDFSVVFLGFVKLKSLNISFSYFIDSTA